MSHRQPDYEDDSEVEEEISEFSGSENTDDFQESEDELDSVIAPQLAQPTQIDQNLLSHPIFNYSNDFFLKSLGQILRPLLTTEPYTENLPQKLEQFKFFLFQSIFGNQSIANIKGAFQKLGLSEKTTCGKVLSAKTGVAFRCLDCEPPDNGSGLTSIMCAECFEKSNHEGHRVYVEKLTKANTAFCDCGDSETLKPEGFCPEHTSNQVERGEELNKFPQDLLKNCQDCLRKAFYGGICIFEVAEKLPFGACRNAFISFGQKFMDQVLGFAQNGYTEINNSFILVLSSLLESKFQTPFNQVWHNCDGLTPEAPVAGEVPKAHSCKCTLTSVLLRYGPFIETEIQSKLKKVLMECMQDQKYKDFMTQELVKYVKFLFPSNYIKDDTPHPENSHLVTLNFILCGTEALALKVIESPYFQHYMDIIQSTIKNYEKGNAKLEKAAYYFEDLMNWFINPAYKSVSERIMHHSAFTKDLLEVLATFEKKYLYRDQINFNTQDFQINHRQIIKSFDVQSRLFKGIIHNLKYIIQCSEENKQTLFQNVAREWYKSFQTLENQERAINLNLSLERILAFVLRSYQGEVTQSGIETFFRMFLPEVELEAFSRQILQNVQKTLGILRFITILRDPEWAHLGKGYYFFHYLYLEMDIALSQMMILLASPDDLFETITQNFFSYNQDLQDFCKNPSAKGGQQEDFKNKEAVLKDFLQLLVYLMTDELCLLNLNSRLTSQEQIDSDPHRERIVQKAVINLLLGSYWTDVFFVKDNLANKLLSNDSKVNKIIQKVTILNEKDRKIRVKDEYESELDPYIFAKAPLLQSEMINEYASRAQKNPKLDIVGGKSYDDLQPYLVSIQQKLFQSSLSKFLSQLILNASKETYPLIPLALKLVLMNLESRVEENYLTNGFTQKLQEFSKIEDLHECKLVLQKIQEIIKTIQPGEIGDINIQDDSIDLKKKAAQEKMNKIKEEFAKKQALFADKNKEESPVTSSPEKSTTKEDIICQHCLAKVDENNDTYGIPVYIGFSNNLYDTKKAEDTFKKFEYNDLNKAKWWPVLSSCHHYYHEKCFNVMCEGLADDPTLFGGLTRYYCCSLCKNLCNHLLLINSGSQESKSIAQAIRERHAALTATLVDLPGFAAPDLSCRFLFNRTHQYFVETFHLQSQPEALEKAFELYLALFKSLKTSLEPLEGPLNFLDKTFLLKLTYGHIKYHPTSPPNLAMLYTFMHYKLDNILGFIYSNVLMESVETDLPSSLNFLKQYLQIRSIQTVIESQQGPLTLAQCLTLLKGDTSIIHKLSKEFLFPIQKTILAIALIQPSSVKVSKLCNLLCNPQETPEYITQLFQTINVSQTFEKFINESLLELEETITDAEFLRLEALLAKLGPQQMKRSHVFKLAPRHVELPETFLGFNNKYQCQKCSICHQYSRNKQMIVCLICGQVMCSGACFGHESKQKKISGNANKHANEYHLGSSVFQSVFDNVWIFIDAPLNIASIPKDIYIDAIGQPILDMLEESSQIEKLNFKDYQLNQNFSDELKRIINHHEFNKEVRRVILDIEDPDDQAEAILGELGSY